METINEAIKSKGLTPKKLPQEIKDRIKELKSEVQEYNAAVRKYDESPDQDDVEEKRLDDWENDIADKTTEIIQQINDYEEPQPEPAPAPTPEPAPVPDPTPAPEPKKDSSVGWLIFGGAVLILTVGAVNLMKKR